MMYCRVKRQKQNKQTQYLIDNEGLVILTCSIETIDHRLEVVGHMILHVIE